MKKIVLLIALIVHFAAPVHPQDGSAPYSRTLGGLAAGAVHILPDGRFGDITTNNNFNHPISMDENAFAAVFAKNANRKAYKRLFSGGENGVSAITLSGSYPETIVTYEDESLPVQVKLEAFTPFQPGDVKASSNPVIVFRYRLTNPSAGPVDAAVAMSWSNLIGIGGSGARGFTLDGECSQTTLRRGGVNGVQFGYKPANASTVEQNALGEYVLAALDDSPRVTLNTAWNASGVDGFWNSFAASGRLTESKDSSSSGSNPRPAAAVAISKTIPPGETSDYVFVFAWRMPHRFTTEGEDRGAYPASVWSSALKLAETAKDRWPRWQEEIHAWKEAFIQTSLPEWFSHRLMDGIGLLSDSSVIFENGDFAFLTHDPRFPGAIGSPEELLAAFPMLMSTFPQLLESQLRLFAACQLSDGEVPSAAGRIDGRLGTGDVAGGFMGRPDSASAFVLMLYRYYALTGDDDFLNEMAPHLRAALVWLAKRAEGGDALPHGPALDAGFGESETLMVTADLFTAAMRTGEELGYYSGDLEFQSISRANTQNAARSAISQLWNGSGFLQSFNPQNPIRQDGDQQPLGAMPGTCFLQAMGFPPELGADRIQQRWLTRIERLTSGDETGSLQWAESLDPASMTYTGFPSAAMDWVRTSAPAHDAPFGSLHNAGLWWMRQALTGASIDFHRQCLTVGPNPPEPDKIFEAPVETARFSARMSWRRSPLTGQEYCSLTFDRADSNLKIKQAAYRTPSAEEAELRILRVLINGEPAAGQDFTRGSLRAFELKTARTIKRGDVIEFIFASTGGGRIRIDATAETAVNLGARCSIEKSGGSSGALTFTIQNLLHTQQIVLLEMQNLGSNGALIALNGESLAAPSQAGDGVPVLLGTSSLSPEDSEWLRRTQAACIEATKLFAREPAARDLLGRLWDLQERIDSVIRADAEQRGFRLEIGAAETLSARENDRKRTRSNSLVNDYNRARDAAAEFRKNLPRYNADPVLAARVNGFFAPVDLKASLGPTQPGAAPFTVSTEASFPPGAALDMRLTLQLPDGWRAEASGPLQPGPEQLKQGRFSTGFTVTPQGDLWSRRTTLPLTLAGLWENEPFRRQIDLAVGHQFINQWMIAGPVSNERGEAFSALTPPETNIKLDETFKGLNGAVGWSSMTFPSGYVDFNSIYPLDKPSAAFAYVGVYSPREQPVRLEFGAAGDMKIFMNYKEIYAKRHLNQPLPSSEIMVTKLFEGWNHFLVKLSAQEPPWGFYFEIVDIEGKTIPGLVYALDKI
ncbi:MAG: hypothetical protein GC154_06230 [bacterium]|nr:hypothetical protein [bacterium]